jgi:hypothetical protein
MFLGVFNVFCSGAKNHECRRLDWCCGVHSDWYRHGIGSPTPSEVVGKSWKPKTSEPSTKNPGRIRAGLFYKNNPETFIQYLVHVAIQTAFVGAIVGIFSSMAFAFQELIGPIGVGQVITIVSSLLIIRICRPAMILWRKVRNFDVYCKSVPSEIREAI